MANTRRRPGTIETPETSETILARLSDDRRRLNVNERCAVHFSLSLLRAFAKESEGSHAVIARGVLSFASTGGAR